MQTAAHPRGVHIRHLIPIIPAICLTAGTITAPLPAQIARIPFDLHRNKVLVPVTANGIGPLDFIFDTGSPFTVLGSFALARELGVEPQGSVRLGGAGTGSAPRAARTEPIRVSVGGIDVGIETAIVADLTPSLAEASGRPYQGIIGRTLLERYVVRLDFDTREMLLFEPDDYRPPPTAQSLPIRMENGHPHIDAPVQLLTGETVMLDLVVDTGARPALALDAPGEHGIVPPPDAESMIVGRGSRGNVPGRVGRVGALGLGSLTLPDVATVFLDDRLGVTPGADGNLGVEVLRRFDVTFDYPHRRLLLDLTDRTAAPYPVDLSGITLRASGQDWSVIEVADVRSRSPAADAGIRVGDHILSVDGRSGTLEDHERRFTRSGPLHLRLDRGGVIVEAELGLGGRN